MRSTISSEAKGRGVMIRLSAYCLSLLMLVLPASFAGAADPLEFRHSVRPGVLTAHGDWTAALDYDLGLSTALWSEPERESFRKSLSARIGSKGSLAVDPDLNNHPLTADAGFTVAVNMYRPPKVVLGSKPGEYRTEAEGFNCGRLSLSLLAGYETDQRFNDRNITGGAELGYVLTENRGFKSFVPSVFVGYDLVYVDRSDLQRKLGVDDDSSGRLRVFASWKLPVGQWLPGPLDPLNAHFDLRYYLSGGMPGVFRATDRDDAIYEAGGLSYSFSREPLWGFVNAVFVRVAHGRIPPVTDDATTVTVGLAVWER